MELTLKSNNQDSIAKIIALAKKLNVSIERKDVDSTNTAKDVLKKRILNFKAKSETSFGDGADWQKTLREDRDLPRL